MWCAAKFGRAYERHVGACRIEIEERDEQRDHDFHLIVEGRRLPFQVASVHDDGRRLGDDYGGRTKEQVDALLDERPMQTGAYAVERVRSGLRAKRDKNYAGAGSLHLLLYLNVNAWSVMWPDLVAMAKVEGAGFASVWVMSEHVVCCIAHSGNTWPVLPAGWLEVGD
jgi:hypothetical protein